MKNRGDIWLPPPTASSNNGNQYLQGRQQQGVSQQASLLDEIKQRQALHNEIKELKGMLSTCPDPNQKRDLEKEIEKRSASLSLLLQDAVSEPPFVRGSRRNHGSSPTAIKSFDDISEPSTNLFLQGLPPNTTEEQITGLMQPFGRIQSVKIIYPRTEEEIARSKKGINGFAAFEHRLDAERARETLDGKFWNGVVLKIAWGQNTQKNQRGKTPTNSLGPSVPLAGTGFSGAGTGFSSGFSGTPIQSAASTPGLQTATSLQSTDSLQSGLQIQTSNMNMNGTNNTIAMNSIPNMNNLNMATFGNNNMNGLLDFSGLNPGFEALGLDLTNMNQDPLAGLNLEGINGMVTMNNTSGFTGTTMGMNQYGMGGVNAMTVHVEIVKPKSLRSTIDELAHLVVSEGHCFEQQLMLSIGTERQKLKAEAHEKWRQEQALNPGSLKPYVEPKHDFDFLWAHDGIENIYYRWRVFSLGQGDTLRAWRTEPFHLAMNGKIWIPPRCVQEEKRREREAKKRQEEEETLAKVEEERKRAKELNLPPRPAGGTNLLPAQERAKLEACFKKLNTTRKSILDAMMLCLDLSGSSIDVVRLIVEYLTRKATPWHEKLSFLYLVNDILHNMSSVSLKSGWTFRKEFESFLPSVFEHFNYCLEEKRWEGFWEKNPKVLEYKKTLELVGLDGVPVDGSMKESEEVVPGPPPVVNKDPLNTMDPFSPKSKILKVLKCWEGVYTPEFIKGLECCCFSKVHQHNNPNNVYPQELQSKILDWEAKHFSVLEKECRNQGLPHSTAEIVQELAGTTQHSVIEGERKAFLIDRLVNFDIYFNKSGRPGHQATGSSIPQYLLTEYDGDAAEVWEFGENNSDPQSWSECILNDESDNWAFMCMQRSQCLRETLPDGADNVILPNGQLNPTWRKAYDTTGTKSLYECAAVRDCQLHYLPDIDGVRVGNSSGYTTDATGGNGWEWNTQSGGTWNKAQSSGSWTSWEEVTDNSEPQSTLARLQQQYAPPISSAEDDAAILAAFDGFNESTGSSNGVRNSTGSGNSVRNSASSRNSALGGRHNASGSDSDNDWKSSDDDSGDEDGRHRRNRNKHTNGTRGSTDRERGLDRERDRSRNDIGRGSENSGTKGGHHTSTRGSSNREGTRDSRGSRDQVRERGGRTEDEERTFKRSVALKMETLKHENQHLEKRDLEKKLSNEKAKMERAYYGTEGRDSKRDSRDIIRTSPRGNRNSPRDNRNSPRDNRDSRDKDRDRRGASSSSASSSADEGGSRRRRSPKRRKIHSDSDSERPRGSKR